MRLEFSRKKGAAWSNIAIIHISGLVNLRNFSPEASNGSPTDDKCKGSA